MFSPQDDSGEASSLKGLNSGEHGRESGLLSEDLGFLSGDIFGDIDLDPEFDLERQGLNGLLSGDFGLLSGDLCGDLGVLSGDRDQDLVLERQHSASSSLSTESKLLPYPPLFRL